jgi:hypothetical protein
MTGHAGIAANPVEPQRFPAFYLPPNHVGAQRDRRLILISNLIMNRWPAAGVG